MDLSTYLEVLWRGKWKILLVLVVAVGLALGYSEIQDKRYEASSELLFSDDDVSRQVFETNADESTTPPERVAATNLALASLDRVAQRVRRRLGTDLSLEELQERVELEQQGQADLVRVTATAPTPEEAVVIADTYAEEVVDFRAGQARADIQRAIDALREPAGPGVPRSVARERRRRADQLEVLKTLEDGDVEIVQTPLLPTKPSAPRPVRNGIVAGVLGLILGGLLVLLLHRLDRRVRDEDTATELAGAPILARIPRAGSRRRAPLTDPQLTEALQFLRSNVQLHEQDAPVRTIAITSALPLDGKTTISAGLAGALALSGARVLAVDCDLRNPRLHEVLGSDWGDGVTQGLLGVGDPEQLARETHVPGLHLLPAGSAEYVPTSTLISSKRLPPLMARLEAQADYVVVDTPPLVVAADASVIAAAVDGVILVVDLAKAKRADLTAARNQLATAGAQLLGIVVNRVAHAGPTYAYGAAAGRNGRGPGHPAPIRPEEHDSRTHPQA